MSAVVQKAPEEVIVFLNYRTAFESDNLDTANLESWREVLDSFGYKELGRVQFLRELALATPMEVMQSLCPYTTKVEWEPVLNKRAVRMEAELKNLCPVELLPVQGLKTFLISCAKKAEKLTTIFLSPFTEANTKLLLDRSEFSPFIDLVHCYSDRQVAILEALEALNIKPPIIPDVLRHKWEAPGEKAADHKCRFVAFEADPVGIKVACEYGMHPIGVSFNSFENGSSERGDGHVHAALRDAEDGGSSLGTRGDALLLESGACCVLRDYSSLDFEFLHHIMVPRHSARTTTH